MTNFKKSLVLTTSALGLLAITTAARAEDAPADNPLGGKFTGSVALASNYIFRGVSNSDDLPAVQGGITFTHDSGIYLGWWGSSTKESFTGSPVETDAFIGYSGTIDAITYDVGYIYYYYAGSTGNVGLSTDYSELYGTLTYDFGFATLKGGLYYSFDNVVYRFAGFKPGSTWYPFLETKIPVIKDGPLPLTIFAHYGVFVGERSKVPGINYNDWNVGVTTNIVGLDLSLGYYDTNKDNYALGSGGRHLAKAKFAAVVSKSF